MADITEAQQELIAAAELGEQARAFIASDLGRVVLGFADQHVKEALESLGDVPPTDIEKIRDLQNQVKVGRWFPEWLNELLADGENAINVFRQQREN